MNSVAQITAAQHISHRDKVSVSMTVATLWSTVSYICGSKANVSVLQGCVRLHYDMSALVHVVRCIRPC